LEVRVLPGPPNNKINNLDGILATLATVIGDSFLTVAPKMASGCGLILLQSSDERVYWHRGIEATGQ
jgi:hypothetical protein